MKKRLPIGISTLAKIREGDYLYIDKTHHISNLANNSGEYYFLSRPRRFGKSLLVDTLKQTFLANRKIFSGLYLEHNWDWETKYPVIHFDFGSGVVRSRQELDVKISQFLDEFYHIYDIENIYHDISGRFDFLIKKLAEKYQQKVVILIDEYDKPMLDNIHNKDQTIEAREGLKNLYNVIKAHDANLRFVLLTGVSKFSKISLFSGLNNLEDITLDPQYADICGYTQVELEREFAEYLAEGKVDLAKLKLWYNGYNFAGTEEQKVYNPFDILLFCRKNYIYRNYWFETATPTFLVQLVEQGCFYIPQLEEIDILDDDLAAFDVGNMALPVLLLQTGYLTIKTAFTLGTQLAYTLTYPNLEVKTGLNNQLAGIGTKVETRVSNLSSLFRLLNKNDIAGLSRVFQSFFASIPHDWYRNNPIGQYEGFYASIVYSYLAGLGYDLQVEDSTNQGKIDLTLITPDKILIFEFKLTKYGTATESIEQIKAKNYPQKYIAAGKPIYLLGISFNPDEKNVADFSYVENIHLKDVS